MSAKGTKTRYHTRVEPDTLPALDLLSADLGFFVDVPGTYYGEPSKPDLLDALAAAYRRDPAGLVSKLQAAGVTGAGSPPPR